MVGRVDLCKASRWSKRSIIPMFFAGPGGAPPHAGKARRAVVRSLFPGVGIVVSPLVVWVSGRIVATTCLKAAEAWHRDDRALLASVER
jgi:hypothetical protein